MARRRSRESVRFDLRGVAFAAVAQRYRAALKRAERLWRRLHRDDVRKDPLKEDRARIQLAEVERELDAARRALFEQTARVATDPMRTHVKRLGLGAPDAEVA